VFFFLGASPPGVALADTAPNHSSRFVLDEGALVTGVRALAQIAVDTLSAPAR
jgi:amidohydrolase